MNLIMTPIVLLSKTPYLEIQYFGRVKLSSINTPLGITNGCLTILSGSVSGGRSNVSMSASIAIEDCCSLVSTIGRDKSAQILISPDGTFGSPYMKSNSHMYCLNLL